MSNEVVEKIKSRYDALSDSSCCLSCGGAINYAAFKYADVCVDLGSGRGTDAIKMAGEVGEKGFVYGIDISDGMIEKAKKNAEKFNIKNVQFIKSELENIPLNDNSVDLVISNCTINHTKDKQKVWNEVYRILKEGGRFVVSDIYSIEEIPDEYRNDPEAIAECWAGAVTRETYMKQLKISGFKDITVIEESSPYKKGKVMVASFTISGQKREQKCCCC